MYNGNMSSGSLPPPHWVADPSALRKLVEVLSVETRLAVDTESNSLHAYRERVCLIQFSTPQADYLVDPFSLDDLSSLGVVFSNPKIEKVFHAAEYDLIGLKRDFDFQLVNLFDTMQSARILGYSHVGLDALLADKFNVLVNKRYQKADWGQRPLPVDLMAYARLDTHYLLSLRDLLETELAEEGRLALAREDFSLACLGMTAENGNGKAALWQRAARQHHLDGRQQTVLMELCQAREELAQRYDRPVFKVVSDTLLIELARQSPQTDAQLFAAGLTSRQVERFGRELADAVRKGMGAPIVQEQVQARPDPRYLARQEALKSWRKCAAQEMKLESDIILPRRFLQMLAGNPPRTLDDLSDLLKDSPWRLEHFGAQILSVLKR